MGVQRKLWVDEATHMLHFYGQTFPCDRDIEAALAWEDYALLLSSDTDALSLWDCEGLVRLTTVGVYPQDMVILGNQVIVCGGADGKLHLLALPELTEDAEISVPGMPERLCIVEDMIFILTLMVEPEVHTALLRLSGGQVESLRTFAGIPEAIAADKGGLWIAVSEGVTRLLWTEIGT